MSPEHETDSTIRELLHNQTLKLHLPCIYVCIKFSPLHTLPGNRFRGGDESGIGAGGDDGVWAVAWLVLGTSRHGTLGLCPAAPEAPALPSFAAGRFLLCVPVSSICPAFISSFLPFLFLKSNNCELQSSTIGVGSPKWLEWRYSKKKYNKQKNWKQSKWSVNPAI